MVGPEVPLPSTAPLLCSLKVRRAEEAFLQPGCACPCRDGRCRASARRRRRLEPGVRCCRRILEAEGLWEGRSGAAVCRKQGCQEGGGEAAASSAKSFHPGQESLCASLKGFDRVSSSASSPVCTGSGVCSHTLCPVGLMSLVSCCQSQGRRTGSSLGC